MEFKRKPDETPEKLLKKFNRFIQQSGLLKLAKRKMFHEKEPTRRERREQAMREAKIKEIRRKKFESYY